MKGLRQQANQLGACFIDLLSPSEKGLWQTKVDLQRCPCSNVWDDEVSNDFVSTNQAEVFRVLATFWGWIWERSSRKEDNMKGKHKFGQWQRSLPRTPQTSTTHTWVLRAPDYQPRSSAKGNTPTSADSIPSSFCIEVSHDAVQTSGGHSNFCFGWSGLESAGKQTASLDAAKHLAR